MGSIREEFEKFIAQGNLVQLAIAFVIGAAFSAVVTALVTDLITPLIGIAGGFNFSSWQFEVNGSKFMQGAFLNAILSFVIIALVVFFLIALPYQRYLDRKAAKAPAVAATTRTCPECQASIPIAATRCQFCTQPVPPVPPPATPPLAKG